MISDLFNKLFNEKENDEETVDTLKEIADHLEEEEKQKSEKEYLFDICQKYGKEYYINEFLNMFFHVHTIGSNKMIRVFHVTHNDSDAIGCDVIVNLTSLTTGSDIPTTFYCDVNSASKYIKENIIDNNKPEYITFVLITDISVNDEVADMVNMSKNIIPLLIDHHKSNKRSIEYWGYVNDELKLSAAALLLGFVRNNYDIEKVGNGFWFIPELENEKLEEILVLREKVRRKQTYSNERCKSHYPKDFGGTLTDFINDISRYDTWEWQKSKSILNDEDTTSIAIKVTNRNYSLVTRLIVEDISRNVKPFTDMTLNVLINSYKKHEEDEINKFMDRVQLIQFKSCSKTYTDIPFVLYEGDYVNKLMERMYTTYKDAELVMLMFPLSGVISLRTNKPSVDVSKIAVDLARDGKGGGHETSAGFTPKPGLYNSLLTQYYK